MTTSVTTPRVPATAAGLRRLYFVRFVFAAVWVAVTLPLAGHLDPVTVALLVIYPLFDVAAAVADIRASRPPDRRPRST
nr:hypothetical protein [Micromonospora provocatoris]